MRKKKRFFFRNIHKGLDGLYCEIEVEIHNDKQEESKQDMMDKYVNLFDLKRQNVELRGYRELLLITKN